MTERQRTGPSGAAPPPVDFTVFYQAHFHRLAVQLYAYLGDHAEYIAGMPYDEGRALIEELNALAIHPDLTYEHRWTPRQLIVWDNRCVLHRATAYDEATQPRVIRRCTVLGEIPA